MQHANGRILEQNAVVQRRDLIFKEGVVAQVTHPYYKSREEVVIDAEGGYVLPGLIDLHGFEGCRTEFVRTGRDGRRMLAAWLASQGVTGYVGAAAMPSEQLEEVLDETRLLYRQDMGGQRSPCFERKKKKKESKLFFSSTFRTIIASGVQ